MAPMSLCRYAKCYKSVINISCFLFDLLFSSHGWSFSLLIFSVCTKHCSILFCFSYGKHFFSTHFSNFFLLLFWLLPWICSFILYISHSSTKFDLGKQAKATQGKINILSTNPQCIKSKNIKWFIHSCKVNIPCQGFIGDEWNSTPVRGDNLEIVKEKRI